jgi:hypothetical protein
LADLAAARAFGLLATLVPDLEDFADFPLTTFFVIFLPTGFFLAFDFIFLVFCEGMDIYIYIVIRYVYENVAHTEI